LESSSRFLKDKRTDRLIEKSYKYTDTVYLYSFSDNFPNIMWYYKDEFMYYFYVYRYKTVKYKPIKAQNVTINDNIDFYFDYSFGKVIPCFVEELDGSMICIFVNEKDSKCIPLQENCLFNTKYEPNTFPYKLQYDLSIIFKERGIILGN
jgi:hypothetical protein